MNRFLFKKTVIEFEKRVFGSKTEEKISIEMV